MSKKEKADIVLFHPEGEEYLKTMVLKGFNYTVFDPSNDVTFSFNILLKTLFDNLMLNFGLLAKSFFSPRQAKNFYRKFSAVYIANQLREIEPKVILTFIDNSSVFHLVCEAYKETPFLAIQNGGRHSWCVNEALPDPDLKYHISEYFCFGPYVQNLFEKHQHSIEKYITCGSLLGGYYFSTHQPSLIQEEKTHDICLISQWHSHFSDLSKMPRGWVRLGEAIDILTANVAHFASENSMKVCVALRSDEQEERNYYIKYFKGNCVFQQSERLTFSSYKAVTSSKLVIAINSTLATESFGAGLKVLFVNPFGEKWLKPTSSEGPWNISAPDYEKFSDYATKLLNMEMDVYHQKASSEMKNVVSYDFKNPAHKVIRKRLLQLVGEANK
jgi:surface carbohydrate biosynthesis protein